MPELPEVETVVRDLSPLLTGKRISSVSLSAQRLRRPWLTAWNQELLGATVRGVRRRGKWIVIELSPSPQPLAPEAGARGYQDRYLVLHLGMTGQLTVVHASEPEADHVHLTLGLGNGSELLRFRDIRRFGSAALYPSEEELERFFDRAGLGPEPFALPSRIWRQRLAATRRCLKAVLLDQRVVAGVGNIYADESLFQARLHPAREACGLTGAEAERLRKAVVAVLQKAIDCRGSSIRNYVGGSGLKGGYQDEFRVYSRTGRPCPRCKTLIEQTRLAGRSTHYCPACQPRVP